MGTADSPEPVKLMIALMAQNKEMIAQGRIMLETEFGDVDSESESYPFSFSDYYQKEMGLKLIKQFTSFKDTVNPGTLSSIKHITNEMEMNLQRPDGQPGRRINLDPGYINGAQLVLATTKNYSHRLYLDQGIYGEVTLIFRKGNFQALPWTYPDYKTDLAYAYFKSVRQLFLTQR